MKKIIWLLLLSPGLLIFSCNSEKEPTPVVTNPVVNDSLPENFEPSSSPYTGIDVSPMDMCYFPVDYPKLRMAHTIVTPPLARVVYSRPHLGGRQLFLDILKYDEAWRLGANEATEIQFFNDVRIQGKTIKAGRYTIYCVPHPDTWTIVINSNLDTWGLSREKEKDIARFVVPSVKTNNHVEFFTMIFEKTDPGADLIMAWGSMEVRLPIVF